MAVKARRYLIHGRVQGVGYRYFVQRAAGELGIHGWARNLQDGRVEVYAAGTESQLAELSGYLHQGPRWSDVHGVEQQEAAMEKLHGFSIRG